MSSSPSDFAVDGLTPATVVEPQSDAETADVLAEARQARHAVIPAGGGTLLHVGEVPTRYDIALSTRRLSGIVEYSPGDLTVVVRAGTTVQELQDELAKYNQFLPLHPAHPERATVGGTLATAMSGPWRTAYGSARDFTLGMRMALPSGQVAKSGGKVVKNVAGYDLAKLFIGSYGSLGVITEAAFKVYPRPAAIRRLRIRVRSAAETVQLARPITGLAGGVLGVATWMKPLARGGGPNAVRHGVIVMLGGAVATVRELEERVRTLAGSEAKVDDFEPGEEFLANQVETSLFRLSVPPRQMDHLLPTLIFPLVLGYPAVGAAYISAQDVDSEHIRDLRERVQQQGGQLLLLQASPTLKRETGVWGPPPPEMSLMRRVKDVFDPERIMSPGRFVGGL